MMFARGKVVDGKVIVEGPALEEGAEVMVLLREDEEDFELTPQQEAELLESIEQANRGDTVDGFEFLDSLRR
jgi:hypothetical protein